MDSASALFINAFHIAHMNSVCMMDAIFSAIKRLDGFIPGAFVHWRFEWRALEDLLSVVIRMAQSGEGLEWCLTGLGLTRPAEWGAVNALCQFHRLVLKLWSVSFEIYALISRLFLEPRVLFRFLLCRSLQLGLSEGRWFETQWGQWIFSINQILPAALGPGVYSASNRNEY
jgi:hypothetical protein